MKTLLTLKGKIPVMTVEAETPWSSASNWLLLLKLSRETFNQLDGFSYFAPSFCSKLLLARWDCRIM